MLRFYKYRMLALAILLMVAISSGNSAPVSTYSVAEHYLSQYGYLCSNELSSSMENSSNEKTWEKAIIEFQTFAKLNVTGKLDDETMQMMSLPRCIARDKMKSGSDTRFKRYVLHGGRWNTTDLTYRIAKYSKQLDRTTVDQEIAKAFSVWSEHTDLTFTRKKTGTVDIEIRFEEGNHGDRTTFDGPGGLLSHGYFPEDGGDVHFDDAEQWTSDTTQGTNLFQAAVHEFGHSLGLHHSEVRSSIMSPFNNEYDPKFQLDSDDIKGIQALYGAKTSDFIV